MEEKTISLTADCKVRGQTTTARGSDTKINVFKGIPYALPPSGNQRFMPPQTFPLWTGTRDAYDYGPVCPQNKTASTKSYFPFSFSPNMSDDCLYLNVWTPSLNIASKLPVMVWIYGGAYQRGSGNYHIGTAMAARQNVVYVAFNYRIGAFGFLCTGDDVVKGNMGLLDQIEALRWVQRHIVQFGGDPDNVTVFGESAGSISITHHIVSPLSRGLFKSAVKTNSLFRRGICQSGTCFYPGAYFSPEQSRKFLLKRLPAMGCTSTDSKEILEFLQFVPAEEIVKHLALLSYPVKDDARCPEPFEAYETGTFNPVDLMIGFTSHEGADFIFDLAGGQYVNSKEQAQDIVTRVVKIIFYRGHPAADSIIRALCEEYLDEAGSDTVKLTQALVEMYGDLLFVAPTIPHAMAHSKSANTYLYHYEYRQSISSYSQWITADHAHEMPIVIGEPFLERFPDIWSDEDKRVSDSVMSLWASFARNGIPRSADIPEWPQFKQDDQKYLNIGAKSEIRANFKPHRISFWTESISSILSEAPTHLSKY